MKASASVVLVLMPRVYNYVLLPLYHNGFEVTKYLDCSSVVEVVFIAVEFNFSVLLFFFLQLISFRDNNNNSLVLI